MDDLAPGRRNALFVGNSYMNRQERIIPALLRPAGYELTVRTVYAPGQTFEGHLLNNAGEVTAAQREGIERGRIGGWFSEPHCAWLYDTYRGCRGGLDRALSEQRYDAAFVLVGGGDSEEPDRHRSLACGSELLTRIRVANPGILIVLLSPWTYLGRPEFLPQFVWVAQRLALEHGCRIAPVGTAFRRCEERLPGLFLHRSRKDSHQNGTSILLAAYTQVCAALGARAATVDFSANRADLQGIDDTATSLEPATEAVFQDLARTTTREAAQELAGLSLATLARPAVVRAPAVAPAESADRRLLVIGNSWLDAHGALWSELANSYRDRDGLSLHIEAQTDDAATFQSILANDAGDLTPRQRRILETVGRMQASMGQAGLDMDALDGLGDYPVAMAVAQLAGRKGRLGQALARPVRWDAVVIQAFRAEAADGEDDFHASGRVLIERIRAAVGPAPVLLMSHWARKGAAAADQGRIDAACRRLAEDCGVPLVPVGAAFAARSGTDLLADAYTPNPVGVQLASETLRRHLGLERPR